MRLKLSRAFGVGALVLLVFLFCLAPGSTFASGPGGHGCAGGNLIPNCGFDSFYPHQFGQIPDGWQPFVLAGALAYDSSPDTFWGAPSLRMWSDGGTFVAGIFTQVGGLTPGVFYRASMGWGAPTEPDAFGRRLGIDPTGGTDPNASSVVWGPMLRGPGKVLNDSNPGYPNIDVSAMASSPAVTVFVFVDHPYSTGQNQIFIDAVGLYVDPAQPTRAPEPTQAPPTAVQPSARRVAEPAKPSTTPTITPTSTATHTATVTPTSTPTSTPTLTPTPTQTLTPAPTPTSTLPPRPRATPGTPSIGHRQEHSHAGMLWGGAGALGSAGLLGLLLALTRRR